MTFSISGKNVLRFPFSGSRLHTVSRRIATKSESNVQRRTTPTKKPSSKALLIRVAPATARKLETLAAQQDRSLAEQTRTLIDLCLNALPEDTCTTYTHAPVASLAGLVAAVMA